MKYVTALYREAMTPAVLAWDPSSNNRAMLAGQSSLVMNAISITRSAENDRLPIGPKIALAPPPRGPARRAGLPHATSVYVIWKFAENIDGAKAFLVDLVGRSREAFQASESYDFPAFPDQVKDLRALLAKDAKATPAGQVRGARRRALVDEQSGRPGPRQRGARRRLWHLGAEHDVRAGGDGRRLRRRTR